MNLEKVCESKSELQLLPEFVESMNHCINQNGEILSIIKSKLDSIITEDLIDEPKENKPLSKPPDNFIEHTELILSRLYLQQEYLVRIQNQLSKLI